MAILSIVMPVYNAEQFLHRSIDSIINQTFTEWELILVDDGSVDNSPQICDEYAKKDQRIRVIHKKNGGSGPARNAGIEIAQGEFLAFPDSDDWMDVEAYNIAVGKMQETAADLLVFGIRTHMYNHYNDAVEKVIEEKLQTVHYKTVDECRCNYICLHKRCNMNSPCNKIYRLSVIKQNNIRFPDLRRMQDGVFNMDYYDKIESLVVLEHNLFNRTWHMAEVEKKKLPDSLLQIAITYHQTVTTMLQEWDKYELQAQLFFDEYFLEIVKNMLLNAICEKSNSHLFRYRYLRRLNRNAYVKGVLKNYKQNQGTLPKFEYAMLHDWNLALFIWGVIKAKNK